MMPPEDQYPSTHDCAKKLEGDQDGVLLCLVNSRERVDKYHSRTDYIADYDEDHIRVCAIGAVFMADGLTSEDIELAGGGEGAELLEAIELQLSTEAKMAIKLLNEATLELHPESADYRNWNWSGPLEWLNQSWGMKTPERQRMRMASLADREAAATAFADLVKTEVLKAYDLAIKNRKAGALV